MDDEARDLILARAQARKPTRPARRRKESRHAWDTDTPEDDEETERRTVPVAGLRAAHEATRAAAEAKARARPAPPDREERRRLRQERRRALAAALTAEEAAAEEPPAAPADPISPGVRLPPATTTTDRFWNDSFRALAAWVERHGAAIPSPSDRHGDEPVGRWVQLQRRRRDALSAAQRAALEALPSWCWTDREARWEEGFLSLQRYVQDRGSAVVQPDTRGRDGARVGLWVDQQRRDHAAGRLTPAQAARLEALPGWRWRRA